jgi:IS5 family transposase
MPKQYQQMSFSHYDVSRRTAKNIFYTHINTAISWQPIENEINKHYSPGKSATGQAAYPGILLFKMLLVGFWSGSISDRAVEEMANENLSVMRFLNLRLEDMVPDHSVLSRFRSQFEYSGQTEPPIPVETEPVIPAQTEPLLGLWFMVLSKGIKIVF